MMLPTTEATKVGEGEKGDPNEVIDYAKAEHHMREVLRNLGFYSKDHIDHREHYEGTP